MEFSSLGGGVLRRGVYFQVFETEPDFRAIFDYFRRIFVIDFPVFGRGGGSDQKGKIPVFFFFFFFEPFPKKWLSYGPIRDCAALHGILQCCRVYVFPADFILST